MIPKSRSHEWPSDRQSAWSLLCAQAATRHAQEKLALVTARWPVIIETAEQVSGETLG